jgi:hypothetical protein
MPAPESLIAACPTSGWPSGFHGRRVAFLIVLTKVLGYTTTQARQLRTGDIDPDPISSPISIHTAVGPRIRGSAVPTSDDPRSCPACAVVRWLETLGAAEGLGRGSARMHLHAAQPTTPTSPHNHTITSPHRWRQATQLLPAIDRHGWIEDYRPMSTRSITTRLALAASRCPSADPFRRTPSTTLPCHAGRAPYPASRRSSLSSTKSPTMPTPSTTASKPSSTRTSHRCPRVRAAASSSVEFGR